MSPRRGKSTAWRDASLHYRLLPDFDQVPVGEQFQAAFDVPVFVEDNIRAVAFGELMRGSGRGSDNFLCLAVRSGVGLGIVIDGKLYRGTNAMAGEAGYMVVATREGPRLVTDLVSATGFVQEVRAPLGSWQSTTRRKQLVEKGDDLSLADIISAAESGDRLLPTGSRSSVRISGCWRPTWRISSRRRRSC